MPGGSSPEPPGGPRRPNPRPGPPGRDPRAGADRRGPPNGGQPRDQHWDHHRDPNRDPNRARRPLPPAPQVDPREHPAARTTPIFVGTAVTPQQARWRNAGRAALALTSALVLLLTGYAWTSLSSLTRGLGTSDVTDGASADGAVDVLLAGNDSRTDSQGHPLPADVLQKLGAGDNDASLTDTLILLHIPEDHSRAVAYSIPRDTYVDIPGHGRHKINSAFGRAKSRATSQLRAQGVTDPAELDRRASEAGRKTLVQTVGQLTGANVDHYAEVNLLGFYQITQAIGGVQVCLKRPVEDSYSGAHFRAGVQTVAGTDAMGFVRQRHGLPRGDLDRVRRQQAFLAGLSRAMLSSGTLSDPGRLSALFQSLQKSLVLDQGWDVLTFAQQMQNLSGGNITFDTIPVEDPSYSTSEGQAVQVDPHEVRETVQRVNRGLPPTPPPPPQISSTTVNVRNGSSISGLAGKVAGQLKDKRVPVDDVGNGPSAGRSKVSFAPGSEQVAQFVAHQLGDLPTVADPQLHARHVQVQLTRNYSGPGAQNNLAGAQPVRLDGGMGRRAAPAKAAAPSGDAITAGGIPCVN